MRYTAGTVIIVPHVEVRRGRDDTDKWFVVGGASAVGVIIGDAPGNTGGALVMHSGVGAVVEFGAPYVSEGLTAAREKLRRPV